MNERLTQAQRLREKFVEVLLHTQHANTVQDAMLQTAAIERFVLNDEILGVPKGTDEPRPSSKPASRSART